MLEHRHPELVRGGEGLVKGQDPRYKHSEIWTAVQDAGVPNTYLFKYMKQLRGKLALLGVCLRHIVAAIVGYLALALKRLQNVGKLLI